MIRTLAAAALLVSSATPAEERQVLTIDEAVAEALRVNDQLAAARYQAEGAEDTARSARGRLLPTLNASDTVSALERALRHHPRTAGQLRRGRAQRQHQHRHRRRAAATPRALPPGAGPQGGEQLGERQPRQRGGGAGRHRRAGADHLPPPVRGAGGHLHRRGERRAAPQAGPGRPGPVQRRDHHQGRPPAVPDRRGQRPAAEDPGDHPGPDRPAAAPHAAGPEPRGPGAGVRGAGGHRAPGGGARGQLERRADQPRAPEPARGAARPEGRRGGAGQRAGPDLRAASRGRRPGRVQQRPRPDLPAGEQLLRRRGGQLAVLDLGHEVVRGAECAAPGRRRRGAAAGHAQAGGLRRGEQAVGARLAVRGGPGGTDGHRQRRGGLPGDERAGRTPAPPPPRISWTRNRP